MGRNINAELELLLLTDGGDYNEIKGGPKVREDSKIGAAKVESRSLRIRITGRSSAGFRFWGRRQKRQKNGKRIDNFGHH